MGWGTILGVIEGFWGPALAGVRLWPLPLGENKGEKRYFSVAISVGGVIIQDSDNPGIIGSFN
jgi:hypothetical protein